MSKKAIMPVRGETARSHAPIANRCKLRLELLFRRTVCLNLQLRSRYLLNLELVCPTKNGFRLGAEAVFELPAE